MVRDLDRRRDHRGGRRARRGRCPSRCERSRGPAAGSRGRRCGARSSSTVAPATFKQATMLSASQRCHWNEYDGRVAGPAAFVGRQRLPDLRVCRRSPAGRCSAARARRCRRDRIGLLPTEPSSSRRRSSRSRCTRIVWVAIRTDQRVGLLGAVGDVDAAAAGGVAAEPLVLVGRRRVAPRAVRRPSASDRRWACR